MSVSGCLSTLNWGDVPTWIASIGTLAAISIALWQILGDRRRAAEQQRRAQAELISAWYAGADHDHSRLVIRNASDQPIYEAVVVLVINGRSGREAPPEYRRILLVVPPGTYRIQAPIGWRGMGATPGAEVAFTDRTGEAYWVRRAGGSLTEIDQTAIEHYAIDRPFQSTDLRPE